ncbi:MAG: NUDIX hydrolase [Acidobacteriota bacterium]|nr:NUDIX hydrolase [Acidobacteriota bacterium]
MHAAPEPAYEPAQEFNPGAPTAPRPAAAAIVLREGGSAPEALLVRRNPQARFMGGVWVFPGGALKPSDGAEAQGAPGESHREAAMRELREEAGVALPTSGCLVGFARWITPAQVRTRFDTHFYLAELPAGQTPEVDGQECVELRWLTAQAALAASASGELALVFPTIRQLEALAGFGSVAALLDHFRERPVETVEPRVLVEDGSARIVLPGEAGYDD